MLSEGQVIGLVNSTGFVKFSVRADQYVEFDHLFFSGEGGIL